MEIHMPVTRIAEPHTGVMSSGTEESAGHPSAVHTESPPSITSQVPSRMYRKSCSGHHAGRVHDTVNWCDMVGTGDGARRHFFREIAWWSSFQVIVVRIFSIFYMFSSSLTMVLECVFDKIQITWIQNYQSYRRYDL